MQKYRYSYKKSIIYLFILFTCFISNPLYAGLGNEMNKFWNELGGGSNSNSARVVDGQTSGYYTMGSLQMRTPGMNIQPLNIQLPSVRAGCGGIDIFAGAFSHINTDQFIAFGKAVLSNAVGYAFQVGLQTLSPMMASAMSKLQAIADEVNNFNMNSCQTSQNLVNGAVGLFNSNTTSNCENMANSSGSASDRAAAMRACQDPNRIEKEINKDSPSSRSANINLIWQALKDGGYIDALGTDIGQDLMYLMGTIIVRMENGKGTIQTIRPTIWDDSVIDVILNGGGLYTLKCDETELCLKPKKTNSLKTISPEDAFKPRITKMLNSMEKKIRNINENTKLSAEETNLIKITSFPILNILITSSQGGGLTSINSDILAELTARDVLIKFTQEISTSVLESISRYKDGSSNSKQIKDIQQNIQMVQSYLQEKAISNMTSFKQAISVIKLSEEFDRKLAEKWAGRMRSTLNFSNQLDNR